MTAEPRFRYDGMTSFRNDRENFPLWLSHFLISEVGGFTSYHNENKHHIFVIKKDGFQAEKVGELKNEIIEPEFLKDEHFRKVKSLQKTPEILSSPEWKSSSKIFDRKVIKKRKS